MSKQNTMEIKGWYGAKTLYEVKSSSIEANNKLYEERVVLIKAVSFEDAIRKAEEEAFDYANDDSGFVYLGFVNAFKLVDEKIRDKTEVFSLMRESNLKPKKYIDRYFDTGLERTKHT